MVHFTQKHKTDFECPKLEKVSWLMVDVGAGLSFTTWVSLGKRSPLEDLGSFVAMMPSELLKFTEILVSRMVLHRFQVFIKLKLLLIKNSL